MAEISQKQRSPWPGSIASMDNGPSPNTRSVSVDQRRNEKMLERLPKDSLKLEMDLDLFNQVEISLLSG